MRFSHSTTEIKSPRSTIQEVVLDGLYYIPFFDGRLKDTSSKPLKQKPLFEVGGMYVLQGTTCDDFDMPIKVYEVKKVLDVVDGINLNSIIVKQVSGPTSTIFSLTKGDCKILGIPFETGLQIFPQSQGWIKYYGELPEESKEVEFDASDYSTYPCCIIDGTIRRTTLKLFGFEMINDSIIKHEQTGPISFDVFMKSLRVYAKKTIKGDGIKSAHISKDHEFPCHFLTSHLGIPKVNGCVDAVGSIYLEFDMSMPQGYTDTHRTSDQRIGVHPSKLVGDISEYIGVKWKNNVQFTTNLYGNQTVMVDPLTGRVKLINNL
jgi:hypothetical protein